MESNGLKHNLNNLNDDNFIADKLITDFDSSTQKILKTWKNQSDI